MSTLIQHSPALLTPREPFSDASEALDSVNRALLSRQMDQGFRDDVQVRRIKHGVPQDSVDFDPKTFEESDPP